MITVQQFTKIFPLCKKPIDVVTAFNKHCGKYGISGGDRTEDFLAQAGHESASFNVMVENLNYSEQALLVSFNHRFDAVKAKECARNPEKIANIAYGGRMGNKNPGDGWKFRGRGYFQLTGFSNYAKFASFMNMTIDAVIAYLETIDGAMESAMWFWNENKLNVVSDKAVGVAGVDDVTLVVNGGLNGEADREAIYKRADANV